MIHVLATITLQPGTRARFLEHFHLLEPLVRAEDGCLEYGAAVDVPSGLTAQPPLRPDDVVVVEKWSSLPALEAHLDAPHMAAYRVAVADLVTGMDLQVLAPPRPKTAT
jgi:quinol monooxygenase YgiN